MNLATTVEIYGGGPGSGCHGSNCGRPASTLDQKVYDVLQKAEVHVPLENAMFLDKNGKGLNYKGSRYAFYHHGMFVGEEMNVLSPDHIVSEYSRGSSNEPTNADWTDYMKEWNDKTGKIRMAYDDKRLYLDLYNRPTKQQMKTIEGYFKSKKVDRGALDVFKSAWKTPKSEKYNSFEEFKDIVDKYF